MQPINAVILKAKRAKLGFSYIPPIITRAIAKGIPISNLYWRKVICQKGSTKENGYLSTQLLCGKKAIIISNITNTITVIKSPFHNIRSRNGKFSIPYSAIIINR